jgi:predicted cobalt transporter CbtA
MVNSANRDGAIVAARGSSQVSNAHEVDDHRWRPASGLHRDEKVRAPELMTAVI